jgi:cell division protein FtsZ
MGSSVSSGENRAKEAIIAALVLLYWMIIKLLGPKRIVAYRFWQWNYNWWNREKSMIIFKSKGHNANIIMGVEDESLEIQLQ